MCVLFKQDTSQGQSQETRWENVREATTEKPTTRPGRAFSLRNRLTRESSVGCKLTFLHCVTSKCSSSAITPRWSTTHLLQQVPRHCVSHAKPRPSWLGHTALWCYTFIWNLTKAISESEDLPNLANLVWFSGLLFNQPFTSNCCTRPGALEEHKQTHRTRGSSLLTSKTVFKLYD